MRNIGYKQYDKIACSPMECVDTSNTHNVILCRVYYMDDWKDLDEENDYIFVCWSWMKKVCMKKIVLMLMTILQIWMKLNIQMFQKCSTHHCVTHIWNTKKMTYSVKKCLLPWNIPLNLVILQNSNISKALYDKIVCRLSYCLDYDAFQHLLNCTKIKRYSMQKLFLEKQEFVIPSIGLPICTCEFIP